MDAFNNNTRDGIYLPPTAAALDPQTQGPPTAGSIIKQVTYDASSNEYSVEAVQFCRLRTFCLGLSSILDLVDRSKNSQFLTLFDERQKESLEERFLRLRCVVDPEVWWWRRSVGEGEDEEEEEEEQGEEEDEDEVDLLVIEAPRRLESERICRAGAKVLCDCKDITNLLVRLLSTPPTSEQESTFLQDTASFGIYIQGLSATLMSPHLVAEWLHVALPEADEIRIPVCVEELLSVVLRRMFGVLFQVKELLVEKARKLRDAVSVLAEGMNVKEHVGGGGGYGDAAAVVGKRAWVNETPYDHLDPPADHES